MPLLWNCYIFLFSRCMLWSIESYLVRDLRNKCLITHIIVTQRYMAFKCHTVCFACQWVYMHPSVFAACHQARHAAEEHLPFVCLNVTHSVRYDIKQTCRAPDVRKTKTFQQQQPKKKTTVCVRTNTVQSFQIGWIETENSHTNLNGWRVYVVSVPFSLLFIFLFYLLAKSKLNCGKLFITSSSFCFCIIFFSQTMSYFQRLCDEIRWQKIASMRYVMLRF